MLDKLNSNQGLNFSTSVKVKEKELSADEFQAKLNEIKEKEDEQKKLQNQDLNLANIKADYISYAKLKMHEDGLKQAQEKHLNKLFKMIDEMNKD